MTGGLSEIADSGDAVGALPVDDEPEERDTAETDIRDRTGGPVGSGSIDIDVDSDTGEANETLSGANRGGATEDAATDSDDVDATEIDATGDAEEVEDRVESGEQAVEDATGGAAFGDPSETEDVGDGEAVTTPSSGDSDSSLDAVLPGSVSPKAILVAVLVVAVAFGGGD